MSQKQEVKQRVRAAYRPKFATLTLLVERSFSVYVL